MHDILEEAAKEAKEGFILVNIYICSSFLAVAVDDHID